MYSEVTPVLSQEVLINESKILLLKKLNSFVIFNEGTPYLI
ncbi:hypothetical protein AB751O23_AV_00040 [Chlamydiales bacterium SCGC AB-751-O23]|nr:hypothetical protein AB751O23_AV_00040 [Chlamydiales bacterium SCGC AB-751-O23]